jgi:hypothetical protein
VPAGAYWWDCFRWGLRFSNPADANVSFILSPPGGPGGLNQSSSFQSSPGSLTETFNSLTSGALPGSGTLAVGSFTATGSSILPADQWGGAGGVGKYAASGYLKLDIVPSKYLGFWWSAGDSGNTVKLYGAGSTLLGTFSAASIQTILGTLSSPNSVVASDNQTYSGALYYSNPNLPMPNTNEPYAYVNLGLDNPALSFTSVEFFGGGFEYDNITISPNYYVPGPLPLVGCAAAFGWCRKLRQRIRTRD